METDQHNVYFRAVCTRDPRFDGKFFVGVKTTGIYCRPICPAKPQKKNVEFFPTAAAAERAGYRKCRRCRPESAPLSSAWSGKHATVRRGLRLLAAGDTPDFEPDSFAEKLGVSVRHLNRLFIDDLGLTPRELYRQRRLDFARRLLTDTRLPVTQIVFSSGFNSIRRFNAAFRQRYAQSASELRKQSSTLSMGTHEPGFRLLIPFVAPLDWNWLLDYFRSHRIHGVETFSENSYHRVFAWGGKFAEVTVTADAHLPQLNLHVVCETHEVLWEIVHRVRQTFDLDTDPRFIAKVFESCPVLSPLVKNNPGLRVPRGWDPFEVSVAVILGQVVSVEQANRLLGQLVNVYGTPIKLNGKSYTLFPTPAHLANATFESIGTTHARKHSIREFCRLIVEKKISLEATQNPEEFRIRLRSIKGIGEWTAEYIALRALGDTDSFLSTDLIIKRACELHPEWQHEKFKPWRSYAVVHLWKRYAEILSNKRGKNGNKK
jgi:AraC family transcriptional regulator of adaptative response / DNA-3-methyladenine glycosylase II